MASVAFLVRRRTPLTSMAVVALLAGGGLACDDSAPSDAGSAPNSTTRTTSASAAPTPTAAENAALPPPAIRSPSSAQRLIPLGDDVLVCGTDHANASRAQWNLTMAVLDVTTARTTQVEVPPGFRIMGCAVRGRTLVALGEGPQHELALLERGTTWMTHVLPTDARDSANALVDVAADAESVVVLVLHPVHEDAPGRLAGNAYRWDGTAWSTHNAPLRTWSEVGRSRHSVAWADGRFFVSLDAGEFGRDFAVLDVARGRWSEGPSGAAVGDLQTDRLGRVWAVQVRERNGELEGSLSRFDDGAWSEAIAFDDAHRASLLALGVGVAVPRREADTRENAPGGASPVTPLLVLGRHEVLAPFGGGPVVIDLDSGAASRVGPAGGGR